jgi:hypothetical protein
MTPLDWYGIGAFALIGLVFCCVRRVSTYLALCAAIVAGFILATSPSPTTDVLLTRILMTTGLAGWVFGLLIVRVMFIRSVSLQLLDRIDHARPGAFDDGIRGRLNDMKTFHLVTGNGNTLTVGGRLVSGLVSACYVLFRIEA